LGYFTPLDSVVFFTRFETKNCLRQRILTSVTVGRPWKTVEEDSSYPLSLSKAGLLVYNVFDVSRWLSAILTVVDVDSSTWYGLSHLGEWQCFLLRLLIRTQSPGPTLVSASQVLSPLIEACFHHGSILQHIF